TTDQKISAFAELGVDIAIVESFDNALAELSPAAFFKTLIVDRLKTQQLVVGYDFKFGKDRKGNTAFLASECAKFGIAFFEGQSVQYEDEPVSSTRIRQALLRGDVRSAANMLGRPYMLRGSVGHGEK